MVNTGKDYEELVRKIQKSLIDIENIPNLKNIKIEKNKIIKDRSDIDREFDIYWEFEIGGNTYRTVIECKDYASPISIEKIDAFLGKTQDIPGLKLVYATKTGYQSGAKSKAEQYNIELLIIREPNESDWVDENGELLVKGAEIKIVATSPPKIKKINIIVDKEWLELQNKYKEEDLNNLNKNNKNNSIFINDIKKKEKYSIYELQDLLSTKVENISFGEHCYAESFEDAYIENAEGSISIKIKQYSCEYVYCKPIETGFFLDFSAQILGIVEYYLTGKKKWISHDGMVS